MYKSRAKQRMNEREFTRAFAAALPFISIIATIILFYSFK